MELVNQKLGKYKTISQMQREEIGHLDVQISDMKTELFKKEEELKALDQKYLKIQFNLRRLEGSVEENREVNKEFSALLIEYEAVQELTTCELDFIREKLEAAPKVPAEKAADTAQVADMRAQIEALFAEINDVKVKN